MKKFTQYFNKCALSEAVETSNPTKKRLSAVFDLVADDSRDFGIVSSFQSKATEEVNAQTHDELKSKVIDMGYGYIELCSSSKKEGNDVSEKSLMVPNITKTQIITLGRQFDQPLVMFKNSINFYYISTNETKGIGKVLMKFEKGEGQDNLELAKHKVTDFFSALESGGSGAKTGEETPPDRSKTQTKASPTDYLPTNSGNAKVYAPTKGTQNKKPKIIQGTRQDLLKEISEGLGDQLNTTVKIALGRKKGQLIIDFATVADLNRILDEIGYKKKGS